MKLIIVDDIIINNFNRAQLKSFVDKLYDGYDYCGIMRVFRNLIYLNLTSNERVELEAYIIDLIGL